MSPAVSVGMPVYNGGRFLAETLDSWLAQDLEDFELIVRGAQALIDLQRLRSS